MSLSDRFGSSGSRWDNTTLGSSIWAWTPSPKLGGALARFENGWVKFYRRAWEEDIGSNIYCLCLWVALLSMAHWKESKIVWEGKQRTLPPGSVIFGFKELADKWGCSRSVIKKWAHYLNDTGRIVLETCPRGCIATICNWDLYQTVEDDACSPSAHSVTPTSTQRDTNEPLIEEVKKERKEDKGFAIALADYKKLPGVSKGPKAEERFRDQIKSDADLADLTSAIKNYSAFLSLPENSWRKPKTTLDTFLGSKSRGYFWRDFISAESLANTTSPLLKAKALEDL